MAVLVTAIHANKLRVNSSKEARIPAIKLTLRRWAGVDTRDKHGHDGVVDPGSERN